MRFLCVIMKIVLFMHIKKLIVLKHVNYTCAGKVVASSDKSQGKIYNFFGCDINLLNCVSMYKYFYMFIANVKIPT